MISYEFGYGLSYTTFDYSNLHLNAVQGTPARAARFMKRDSTGTLYDNVYTATFDVTNSGSIASNEISQLYIAFPPSSGEPPKVLRNFAKTFITPGQTSTITLDINQKAISIWDVITQSWIIPSGEFTVLIGKSSRNLPLSATFYH